MKQNICLTNKKEKIAKKVKKIIKLNPAPTIKMSIIGIIISFTH